MKKPFLVFLFLTAYVVFGYSQNYTKVEAIVLRYPTKFSSPERLAKRIEADFSNDFDKVCAVYTWVINNISYDHREGPDGKALYTYSSEKERVAKEKSYRKLLASRVLHKRKAICNGYATLFKQICGHLQIKSEIVSGFGKTKIVDIGKKYRSNHAWNMVTLNNKQYLLDATWGAGFYENGVFTRKPDYFYLLTPPRLFIKDHYPEDYENTLLKEKIFKQRFLNEPIIFNHKHKLISPEHGIIKNTGTGKAKFVFRTEENIDWVSYSIDEKHYQISDFRHNGTLEFRIDRNKFQKGKELIIYINSEAIAGFKIE